MPINLCKAWELSKAVPGIGIVLSNRIIDERKKNDLFGSWKDLEKRVYGIGPKLIHLVGYDRSQVDKTNSKSTDTKTSPTADRMSFLEFLEFSIKYFQQKK